MYLTIASIDKANPRVVEGSLAYAVSFPCDLVEGSATLISSQNIEVGDSISVETEYEALSDLRILSSETLTHVKPLSSRCDYEISGVVSFEVLQEVFYVEVDEFTFRI